MQATSQGLDLDPRRCAFDLNGLPRALRLQAADHGGAEPLEDWRLALWRLPDDQSLAVCAGPPDRKSVRIPEPLDANQIVARIQVWGASTCFDMSAAAVKLARRTMLRPQF